MTGTTIDGTTWLDYKEAGARVRSSESTIRRWAAAGMPMIWGERSGQRARLVDEEVLLAWWRQKLTTAPVEYYRRRRRFREQGLTDPEPPASLTKPRRAPAARRRPTEDGDDVAAHSEQAVDWDALGALRNGVDEWATFVRALESVRPACAGDPRFIADRIRPEEAHALAQKCSACPVLALCNAFAEAALPASGFWAGRKRQRR